MTNAEVEQNDWMLRMLREASEGYESWAAHYSVGVNERARDGVFVTYEGPSLSVR